MSQQNAQNTARDRREALEKKLEPKRNRKISDGGRELAQYIRDLYASGAKLWTKDMFRDIEAELSKEPRPPTIMIRSSTQPSVIFSGGLILTTHSVNGMKRSVQVPPIEDISYV